MAFDENDPQPKAWLSGFKQGLAELGWTERMRVFAKNLVDLQPDVIVANSTPITALLQRETRTIPIVFVAVSDPVGASFVASLPHPAEILLASPTRKRP